MIRAIKNILNFENFLLISWILVLVSINSTYINFNNFQVAGTSNYKIDYIFNIINYLRSFIPIILFLFLSIKFFQLPKKFSLFLLSFFIFSLWQIIIFLIINKDLYQLDQYFLTNNLLLVILIFYFADLKKYDSCFKKQLFIIIIFIAAISLFYTSQLIVEFINTPHQKYLYSSNTLGPEKHDFMQATPRITGVSRMLLVLFFLLFFISIKYNKFNSYKIIISILLFLLSLIIYGTQARGSFIGILILIMVYIFLVKNNFKEKILFLFMFIIIPIISWEGIIIKKQNMKYSELFKDNRVTMPGSVTTTTIDNKTETSLTYSSGRLMIWNYSINVIKNNKIIFGEGPQADRRLLVREENKKKEKIHFWENNASNALIYSYLCGGIISLFFFMLIYFLIFKELILNIKKTKFNDNPIIVQFSFTLILFLISRSLFENSFAVFGIDYCLITVSYFILKQYNSKKNYLK
jgi:O-antigen ligase